MRPFVQCERSRAAHESLQQGIWQQEEAYGLKEAAPERCYPVDADAWQP